MLATQQISFSVLFNSRMFHVSPFLAAGGTRETFTGTGEQKDGLKGLKVHPE